MDPQVCPQFRYVTAMRDPVKRIVSNLLYDRYPPEKLMLWGRINSPGWAMSGNSPIVDNYYIRMLNGVETYFLPLKSINRSHLENAKKILSQFSAILILEDFNLTSQQLTHGLGWPKPKSTVVYNNTTQQLLERIEYRNYVNLIGREKALQPLTAEELAELRELNRLDTELFEFARELARNKTAEFLAMHPPEFQPPILEDQAGENIKPNPAGLKTIPVQQGKRLIKNWRRLLHKSTL